MRAVVLAGGLGTRLRSKVPDIPKVMAPVGGRPFLEYVLGRLITGGITEIILSVGYRADVIIRHFGRNYGAAVLDYAVETAPLNTGGAARYALEGRGTDPALVLNGDTLLDLEYAEFAEWYQESPVPIAVVLRKVQDVARYGLVLVSGERVTGFLEKGGSGPGLINAGVYIVQPQVFDNYQLAGNFSLEKDLLQRHYGLLQPRAFITDGYFIDIGIPEDYERAKTELPKRK